jgi:hypothetical protein
MTVLLEREWINSLPLEKPVDDLEVPQSAEEVARLAKELIDEGERLRVSPDIDPEAKEELIAKLTEDAIRFAISPAEDYRTVLRVSEAAAAVAAVTDEPTPIVEIAHKLIDDYTEPTGNPTIDQINEEQRQAMILAINETDSETSFASALAESTVEIDTSHGRSFGRHIIEPTEIAITILKESRAKRRKRKERLDKARAAGNLDADDDTDTVAIDMSQFLDDDYEVAEVPFDRKQAEHSISFTTFREVMADEDHERVATAEELAKIRTEIEQMQAKAA